MILGLVKQENIRAVLGVLLGGLGREFEDLVRV